MMMSWEKSTSKPWFNVHKMGHSHISHTLAKAISEAGETKAGIWTTLWALRGTGGAVG